MTARFEYPFKDNYVTIDGVRLHYLDEGHGPVVWLMHGNTTWSYLYRKIITPLVKAGYRCFVPDLMGFGLSDKPEDESVYSLKRHVDQMTGLIDQVNWRWSLFLSFPPGLHNGMAAEFVAQSRQDFIREGVRFAGAEALENGSGDYRGGDG